MHYSLLIGAIKKQPFAPFRIVMSSGEKYLIGHPGNLRLVKHGALIFNGSNPRYPEVADEFVRASYLHMAALEPIGSSRPKSRQRRSR